MQKITTFALFTTSFLAIVAAILLSVSVFGLKQDAHANPYTASFIGNATTTSSVSVTSSVRVMATSTYVGTTNTTRVYATFCNPNANPVYLFLGNDAAASNASSTYVIAAGAGYQACYEITDRNLYQGSVTASSTNQTATTIFTSQYTQ